MVTSGLLAFVLVMVLTNERDRMMTVGVAALDLEPGQVLGASSVDFVELPAAVGALEGLVGPDVLTGSWHVAVEVPRGVLLRASDLTTDGPDARRVMSFAVDARVSGMEWVEPGDHIDLVGVVGGHAEFVARSLVVAGVDHAAGLGRQDVTFTVSVEPGDELRIVAALAEGGLHVVRAARG